MQEGFVYILKSKKTGAYYLGSSKDVGRRLKQHNAGLTRSTKKYLPWEVIFVKKYEEISQARKMEYKLKKMKSRIILEKIILDQDIRMGI